MKWNLAEEFLNIQFNINLVLGSFIIHNYCDKLKLNLEPLIFVVHRQPITVNDYSLKATNRTCWPSRGQQVSHQRWIWGIHCVQLIKSTQARDPPWLWNPGQTSPEVQTRVISGPTKRICVLQKNFLRKNLNRVPWPQVFLKRHH